MTPEEQIAHETTLIKELEASYPKRVEGKGRYDQANLPWEIHHTKVRDAYWRRRNAQAQLTNNQEVIAATCEIY